MKQTEIKLIIDDVHDVPKLYINGKHKPNIVSIEYIYQTETTQPGANAYRIVLMDTDEQGNCYERTVAVKKFPSSDFQWMITE